VPQEPFLFSATVGENVAFGAADHADHADTAAGAADDADNADTAAADHADHTDIEVKSNPCSSVFIRRVQSAAAVARLDKDVADFARGFETAVGERGITLSGGQKQRTALARALFVDPKILILDDALSAVDTYTEEEILSRLRGVMRQRTALIVAHRISTVRDADQIFVLHEGRVAERGTHAALVAHNGLYATMYRKQLLEEELQAS
jgi:ABC-type multidrug transport system fused ATPase/permease subunit